MENNKDGYGICLNEWVLDKNIKNELRLLLIISSLCAKEGYCFASNEYFSKLFDEPVQTISKKVKALEKNGYVKIDYKKNGNVIINREIRLTKMLTAVNKNVNGAVNKNAKDNNISITSNINITSSINNTSINNKENIYISNDIYIKEFENLWNIYPNKKGKPKALRKYINARKKGTTYEEVEQGIIKYNKQIEENRTDKQYIKHGSTWFNQECWNDEYDTNESYLKVIERECMEEYGRED